MAAISHAEGKVVAQHHFSEKTLLSFLIELPVCHYYALRCFNTELDDAGRAIDVVNVLGESIR